MTSKGATISRLSATKFDERQSSFDAQYRIIQNQGKEIYRFITENVSLSQEKILIRDVNQSKSSLTESALNVLVDLNTLTFEDGQKYLYQINHLLLDGGLFFCNASVLKTNNWFLTAKKRRSKAEVLGRIVNAGFSIIDFKLINDKFHVCVMKTALPKLEPGYNHRYIIPMMRIGKKGNKLKVFKIRTMYPFSEYLQEYVVGMNGYNEKGKPNNDFRLTPMGRFIRKYWIDELPQVYNLLKGELALVGVRPLSEARFKELPRDVRELRVHYKPGCIPPYVALLMPDSKGNIEAERIYFSEKEKSPYFTDIKYFFKAVYNIVTGKILSS